MRLKPAFSSTFSEPALLARARAPDPRIDAGGEGGVEQRLHRLAHDSPCPSAARPASSRVRAAGRCEIGEADDADELVVEGDRIGPLVGALREDLDEGDARRPACRDWAAAPAPRAIARVVGQPHQVGHVAADRRAQHQPRRLDACRAGRRAAAARRGGGRRAPFGERPASRARRPPEVSGCAPPGSRVPRSSLRSWASFFITRSSASRARPPACGLGPDDHFAVAQRRR